MEKQTVKVKIPKKLYESIKLKRAIKENYGEPALNEASSVLTDPNFIAGLSTFLGLGSAVVAGVLRDLKSAKTPEEKKAVMAAAAKAVGKATTGEEM